jgi:hypothetical protein
MSDINVITLSLGGKAVFQPSAQLWTVTVTMTVTVTVTENFVDPQTSDERLVTWSGGLGLGTDD